MGKSRMRTVVALLLVLALAGCGGQQAQRDEDERAETWRAACNFVAEALLTPAVAIFPALPEVDERPWSSMSARHFRYVTAPPTLSMEDYYTIKWWIRQANLAEEDRFKEEVRLTKRLSQRQPAQARWAVVGYVDAQNSFGAMLRQSFLVVMTRRPGGWDLEERQLEDDWYALRMPHDVDERVSQGFEPDVATLEFLDARTWLHPPAVGGDDIQRLWTSPIGPATTATLGEVLRIVPDSAPTEVVTPPGNADVHAVDDVPRLWHSPIGLLQPAPQQEP